MFLLVPLGKAPPSAVRSIHGQYCGKKEFTNVETDGRNGRTFNLLETKCTTENLFGFDNWLGIYVEGVSRGNRNIVRDKLRKFAYALNREVGHLDWYHSGHRQMYIAWFDSE